MTCADLGRLAAFHVAAGVERLRDHHGGGEIPASATLDLDAADDPTHGHQQPAPFHGYYGRHQYHPLIVSGATARHASVAPLRRGTAHASLGADDDDLTAVVDALRRAGPAPTCRSTSAGTRGSPGP